MENIEEMIMKKEIPLKIKNLIGSIICGACWFLAGVFENGKSIGFMIATGLALIGAGMAMIAVTVVGWEKGDEMSELHFLKAKASTYNSMLFGILILSLVGSINRLLGNEDMIVKWHAWLLIFLGIMQLINGICFARYEKAGD